MDDMESTRTNTTAQNEERTRTLCGPAPGGRRLVADTLHHLRAQIDNKRNPKNDYEQNKQFQKQQTNDSQPTNRDRWPPFTNHKTFALRMSTGKRHQRNLRQRVPEQSTTARARVTVMSRAHSHCIHSLRNPDDIVLQSKGWTLSLCSFQNGPTLYVVTLHSLSLSLCALGEWRSGVSAWCSVHSLCPLIDRIAFSVCSWA